LPAICYEKEKKKKKSCVSFFQGHPDTHMSYGHEDEKHTRDLWGSFRVNEHHDLSFFFSLFIKVLTLIKFKGWSRWRILSYKFTVRMPVTISDDNLSWLWNLFIYKLIGTLQAYTIRILQQDALPTSKFF
jgi:hypothetical protein